MSIEHGPPEWSSIFSIPSEEGKWQAPSAHQAWVVYNNKSIGIICIDLRYHNTEMNMGKLHALWSTRSMGLPLLPLFQISHFWRGGRSRINAEKINPCMRCLRSPSYIVLSIKNSEFKLDLVNCKKYVLQKYHTPNALVTSMISHSTVLSWFLRTNHVGNLIPPHWIHILSLLSDHTHISLSVSYNTTLSLPCQLLPKFSCPRPQLP